MTKGEKNSKEESCFGFISEICRGRKTYKVEYAILGEKKNSTEDKSYKGGENPSRSLLLAVKHTSGETFSFSIE